MRLPVKVVYNLLTSL